MTPLLSLRTDFYQLFILFCIPSRVLRYISHLAISMRQELGAMPAAFLDVSLDEVSRLTHPPRSVL